MSDHRLPCPSNCEEGQIEELSCRHPFGCDCPGVMVRCDDCRGAGYLECHSIDCEKCVQEEAC